MKKLILNAILILWGFHSMAQITFNRVIDFDTLKDVPLTSILPTDSCYYLTGLYNTVAPFKIGNIFLKFNLSGEIVTLKTFDVLGKYYQSWRGDLINSPDGNLIDVGYANDSTMKVFLVKYNLEGDTLLTREYYNNLFPNYDFIVPSQIRRKPDGGYVLLNGIETSNGADISLMVLDEEFNLVLKKAYGTNWVEIPRSLLLDDDGGFVIGANRFNNADQGFKSYTWIFKTDSLGTAQWSHVSLGPLDDIARDMVRTADGGLVVATGKGYENDDNPSFHRLEWHGAIVKFDQDMNVVWETSLRGFRTTVLTAFDHLVQTTDEGFASYGVVADDVSGDEPMLGTWIVKVSANGDSLWSRYYTYFDGIDHEPEPYDFKGSPDGGFVVTGRIFPEGQSPKAWFMKLDSFGCLVPDCQWQDTLSTATAQPAEPKIELAIYPNPTSDYLNFQLRTQRAVQRASFRIVNAEGRIVKEFASGSATDTFIVPVWDWAAGVYFLQYVEAVEVRAVERFVIAR